MVKETRTHNAERSQIAKISSKALEKLQSSEKTTNEGEGKKVSESEVQKAFSYSADQARKEYSDHAKGGVHYYKRRGRCAELFVHKMRYNSIDTNETLRKNFPVVDIIHGKRFYSIKVRGHSDRGVLVRNYAHDLRVALGTVSPKNPGRHNAVELAAKELLECREHNQQVWKKIERQLPTEMRKMTDIREMSKTIIDNIYLLIPSDHVQATREYLRQVARRHPENYGLPGNLAGQELERAIDQLCHRIQPIHKEIYLSNFTTTFRRRTGEA
jgi:hypothetical protein